MNPLQHTTQSRREFFNTGMRLLLLGGIAVLTRFLTGRSIDANPSACPTNRLCHGCRLLATCSLPKAQLNKSDNAAFKRIS